MCARVGLSKKIKKGSKHGTSCPQKPEGLLAGKRGERGHGGGRRSLYLPLHCHHQ